MGFSELPLIRPKRWEYADLVLDAIKPPDPERAACEEFLCQGLCALGEIRAEEQAAQDAAREGKNVPDEVPAKIEEMYREWMEQRQLAEKMIENLWSSVSCESSSIP